MILEQTAGQGTSLGVTFEQLAAILWRAHQHQRLGICLDTCHLLAAGYDFRTAEGYASTFDRFERTVGFDRLRVVHVNDSRMPLGSRVDRHAHIGEGCLGLEPFRLLVNDRRFADLAMILETPKTTRRSLTAVGIDECDARNLSTLRRLASEGAPVSQPVRRRRKPSRHAC